MDTSGPRELVGAGDLLFFSAADVRTGRELWKADTVPVTERITSVQVLASLGDRILFLGSGPEGSGMYASDGTEAGTRYLRAVGAPRSDLAVVAGVLYFTFMTADEGFPILLTEARDRLYFFAEDGEHGRELWVSDGTARGTHPVRDIVPGPGDGIATLPLPTLLGRWLFFVGSTPDTGPELWKTDGTSRGTVRVKDIALGEESSFPMAFTRAGSRVFFIANDGFTGMEPWAVPVSSLGRDCRESIQSAEADAQTGSRQRCSR